MHNKVEIRMSTSADNFHCSSQNLQIFTHFIGYFILFFIISFITITLSKDSFDSCYPTYESYDIFRQDWISSFWQGRDRSQFGLWALVIWFIRLLFSNSNLIQNLKSYHSYLHNPTRPSCGLRRMKEFITSGHLQNKN